VKHVFRSEAATFTGMLDGCSTLSDFICRLRALPSPNRNFVEHGFEALVEMVVTHRKIYDEYNILPINEKNLKIQAIADKKVAVGIFLVSSPDELLESNRNGLTTFLSNSLVHEKLEHYAIFSNAMGIHENTRKNYLKNPPVDIAYYGNKEISELVDGNLAFWEFFRKEISHGEAKVLDLDVPTPNQNRATAACKNNPKGIVLAPTAVGKTLVEDEVILDCIRKNPIPLCILIASPRIVLTYQLLDKTIKHLLGNGIDAQYLNLNSGEFDEDEIKSMMLSKGMLCRDIPSTTSPAEIEKWYKEAQAQGVPLIIGSTYQSAPRILEAKVPVALIIADEAHNLVVGRFSKEERKKFHEIDSPRKYFFTATFARDKKKQKPKPGQPQPKTHHWGMQNKKLFGPIIYKLSPVEAIKACEVLPPYMHIVNVDQYRLNGIEKDTEDVENNIDALSFILREAFEEHRRRVKGNSSDPKAIGAKLLVVCKGEGAFAGFFKRDASGMKSRIMNEFLNDNPSLNLYGISSNSGAFVYRDRQMTPYPSPGSNFKEKFMLALREMREDEDAIIFHIDMIGEGVDVPCFTGMLPFRKMGMIKSSQAIGRGMRLWPSDRKRLKTGEIKPCEYEKMVKRKCWVVIPVYSADTYDLEQRIAKLARYMRKRYGYCPIEDVLDSNGNSAILPPGISVAIATKGLDELKIRHLIEDDDNEEAVAKETKKIEAEFRALMFGIPVTAKAPQAIQAQPRPELKVAKSNLAPKALAGRIASEITDVSEIEAIWKAYRNNGGKLSYSRIEDELQFNLRKANGNTAYRICQKYATLSGKGK